MSKRRMTQIMCEGDCFRQILIQPQSTRDGAADRCHLDRMRQACAQMVAGAVEKNLRLVFQATERARMNDARAIALKFGAIGVTWLRVLPPSRVAGFFGNSGEPGALPLFHLFTRLPFCAYLLEVEGNLPTSGNPLDEGTFRISCSFTYEKACNEKAYAGTPAAVGVRLRAAANYQRGCEQQSF